jgi:hypothetical protein
MPRQPQRDVADASSVNNHSRTDRSSSAARVNSPIATDSLDGLEVKLGSDWIDVPEAAATVIRVHLASRPGLSTAATPDCPLVFPGRMPGRTMHVYSVAKILRDSGIPAMATRSRAWIQMVRHAPPAVLTDALDVNPQTAMRYAERAGTDYLSYAALRSPRGPGRA